MTDKTARIRALNDTLRTTGSGGQIVITRGLAVLGEQMLVRVIAAVQAFGDFNADNDPHGEHDCAMLQVENESILFKIDYYDRQLEGHSPDPTDPNATRRVLTIMLASEY